MRFGFESEKILYDEKQRWISPTALRTLIALEDYTVMFGEDRVKRVTSEFVHNMVEVVSAPSSEVFEVAKDYLFSYELSREVSARTHRRLLPLGSFPIFFSPVMVAKFQYYLKNAILTGTADVGWDLEPHHRLFDAANCAGVHVHAEIDTLPEFLSFTRELMDKHNMALAITPLMAFASSPYFNGKHEAMSMRAKRYYHGVYKDFPEFGGFPPMFTSSADVLAGAMQSMKSWDSRAKALGFELQEIRNLSRKGGAQWGLVRWNRKWNTIELRCFDSDFVGMDIAKFTIASRALKRLDVQGEHLETRIHDVEVTDRTAKALDALLESVMPEILETSGRELTVLPTPLMHRLIHLSIQQGLRSPIVISYLEKLVRVASKGMDAREAFFARGVTEGLKKQETTSDQILQITGEAPMIMPKHAIEVVEWLVHEDALRYREFLREMPVDTLPPRQHPFPSQQTVHPAHLPPPKAP